MPRYKVLEDSFINDQIVIAGEEVEFDGQPGDNLEAIDDGAKAAKDAMQAKADAEAAAVVAGVTNGANQDLLAQLNGIMNRLSTLESAARATPDLSNLATGQDLAKVAARLDSISSDVTEHDVGLSLLNDRTTTVEQTLEAMKRLGATAPAAPAAPADPAPTPTPVDAAPPADTPAPVVDNPAPTDPVA